jgi:MYXO-CTERM domain-containing protein
MRARRVVLVLSAVLSALLAAVPAAARIGFQNNIPNGAGFSCLACHNSAGGGERDGWNAFGDTMFLENGGDADDADTINADAEDFAFWSDAICETDSDGDGATNGLELGDPDCVWRVGDEPATVDGITDPSDPNSVPEIPETSGGCSSGRTTSDSALALLGLCALVTRRRRRRHGA